MELIDNLTLGFATALTLQNLFYCFIGVLIGTLIGVLPGIGPVATLAMLLPVTYALPPTSALIMLAGIYYGAQYGGSTTAILVNLPGESSSVVTCLDGYQMARRGRAGAALATAALGSFFAGTVGVLLVAALALPMVELAFKFGPAEYFSLMVLGLIGAVVLAGGSLIKAIAMILLGLLLGLVGTDVNSGVARFTFDIPELADGINFAAVAMGVFGFAEIIANLEQKDKREVFTSKVGKLMPSKEEFKYAYPAVLRGTALGSVLGVLPGGGALLSAFAAYTIEKKISRNPKIPFGKGNIRGVAAPEAANNAGAQTSFIPMLTLGIPPNAVMALMVGAMTIHNIQPGPQVMSSNPALFWGLITSMWIGNLMLVVLNLPLIGIWVQLLKVPYRLLYPAILVFCSIGIYSINNNPFDVTVTAVFGLIGYIFYKLRCEPAPLILGFILGPMMEENLRRAMLLSRGDATVFFTRPLSLGLLVAAAVLVVIVALPNIKKKREEAFQEVHLATRGMVATAMCVQPLSGAKVQDSLIRARRLPFFCHKQVGLRFDEIREFLVAVEPGVEVGLQLGQVAPEGSEVYPLGIAHRLLERGQNKALREFGFGAIGSVQAWSAGGDALLSRYLCRRLPGSSAVLERMTSVNTNLWHAFRNASGVFFSPNPRTINPSSRSRIARPVKSLSLVIRQNPSNLRVYNKSIASMIKVLSVEFLPVEYANCCTGLMACRCSTFFQDEFAVEVKSP